MNVKTLKRFSKRSVSMLLSVLMVLSLFTVCMVGSSITAGAIVNNAPATTITIHLNGTAAQSWEHVYFVIGRDNSGNYGGSDQPKYTSFYEMVRQTDGTYKTPSGFSFTGAAYYFFTTISIPDDKKGSWKKIDDAYNYVTGQEAARDKVTNKFTTKLTELELTVSNKTFIDATLYNYRSSETGDLDGQIGSTINDTDEEKYELDKSTDYSTGDETDYTHFKAIPHKSRNDIKQKENTRQISRVHNKYSVLY